MSRRTDKFSSTLKHSLAEILLREIANPQLKAVSITHVEVTGDLKVARVLVSSFLGDVDAAIAELEKAKGFIKGRLAKKMVLRYIPELIFLQDTGFDMDDKLSQLSKEKNDEEHKK